MWPLPLATSCSGATSGSNFATMMRSDDIVTLSGFCIGVRHGTHTSGFWTPPKSFDCCSQPAKCQPAFGFATIVTWKPLRYDVESGDFAVVPPSCGSSIRR
jgi:hypothetical protein